MSEKDIIPAEKCKIMADVRRGVDATDMALMELFTNRFAYMDAAARIKIDRSAVRDEERKSAVIANARAKAEDMGIPAEAFESMWEILVEASIDYELNAWDRSRS